MEDIKRKENSIESLIKEKEQLEKRLEDLQKKIKVSSEEKSEGEMEEKSEEEKGEEEVEVKKEKKRGFFGIFKGRRNEEKGD